MFLLFLLSFLLTTTVLPSTNTPPITISNNEELSQSDVELIKNVKIDHKNIPFIQSVNSLESQLNTLDAGQRGTMQKDLDTMLMLYLKLTKQSVVWKDLAIKINTQNDKLIGLLNGYERLVLQRRLSY